MPIKLIKNAIVLAAGRGTRMGSLTSFTRYGYIGPMPKPSLPIVNRPSVLRAVDSCIKAAVRDVFVTSRYMAGHIINIVGTGERFNNKVNIFHAYENADLNTAMMCKEIATNLFASEFKNGDPFFVLPSDTCMPHIDLAQFAAAFKHAHKNDPNLIGAICFILRPHMEAINTHTTAVIDEDNRMVSFGEPPKTRDEAEDIYRRTNAKEVISLSELLDTAVLPINSGVYIMTKKIFDLVQPPSTNESIYDWGKYVFSRVPQGRILAYFAAEPVITSPDGAHRLNQYWINMTQPIDLWEAQYRFLSHAPKNEVPGIYDPERKSYIEKSAETKIAGKVMHSVTGKGVKIGKRASVERCIIGAGCEITRGDIQDSLILPFTYINLRPVKPFIDVIKQSIVGGIVIGGTFVDARTTHFTQFVRKLAAPSEIGTIHEVEDLSFSEEQKALPLAVLRGWD